MQNERNVVVLQKFLGKTGTAALYNFEYLYKGTEFSSGSIHLAGHLWAIVVS